VRRSQPAVNNLLWSILVNRLSTFGESYAVASAYVLGLVPPNQQTDATTQLAANQAAMTTFAGLAVSARQASWYIFDAPFQDAGTNLAPGGLPNQTGNAGKALETDGTKVSWTAVSSGGVTTLAAVGATPNANGGVIAGSTLTLEPSDSTHPGLMTAAMNVTLAAAVSSVGAVGAATANGASITSNALSLSPADATHPGVVTSSAQVFGGNKSAPSFTATGAAAGAAVGTSLGTNSGFGGVWCNAATPSGTNYNLLYAPTFGLFLNAPGSDQVALRQNNVTIASFTSATNSADLTGLGVAGKILIQNEAGVTKTITVVGSTLTVT
jgi:hypothetical protein